MMDRELALYLRRIENSIEQYCAEIRNRALSRSDLKLVELERSLSGPAPISLGVAAGEQLAYTEKVKVEAPISGDLAGGLVPVRSFDGGETYAKSPDPPPKDVAAGEPATEIHTEHSRGCVQAAHRETWFARAFGRAVRLFKSA